MPIKFGSIFPLEVFVSKKLDAFFVFVLGYAHISWQNLVSTQENLRPDEWHSDVCPLHGILVPYVSLRFYTNFESYVPDILHKGKTSRTQKHTFSPRNVHTCLHLREWTYSSKNVRLRIFIIFCRQTSLNCNILYFDFLNIFNLQLQVAIQVSPIFIWPTCNWFFWGVKFFPKKMVVFQP